MGDGGDFIASYRAEWRHFIDCIQRDTKPQCTMEDGRRALQVVLAAIESASSGKPVRIAQPSGGNASMAPRLGVPERAAESAALVQSRIEHERS